ncbi:MAG: HNH endonuclease [Deltaproteobacteria bacterium]|nr:HNH endonuclease [Deltaproteobacteria bacterium]
MSTRDFRTPESYYAERVTRDLIEGFLSERGFNNIRDERKFHGKVESQTIHATSPEGKSLVIKVRLCWRRQKSNDTYSAAQIMPKITNNDWEGSLQDKFQHEINQGVTHTLFIQRESDKIISHAALIPQNSLLEIWCAQRDASIALIKSGKLRRKKNHAMNGSSPTLWLYDERAPEVNKALWEHPGALDLLRLETVQRNNSNGHDDTYDDLLGYDNSLLGNDGGPKITAMRSYVKRDPNVRKAVIARAQGKCERNGCGTSRDYSGFLDVHHILGVGKSDRVYNCVALCPNCHREAHAAPEQAQINAVLLDYAMQFKSQVPDQD